MDTFDRDHLDELLAERQGPLVSVYLPTHRAGEEASQNPIRLKNLLSSAREALVASGMRAPRADEFLEPAQRLLGDDLFWRQQAEGLALFLAPSFARSFRLPQPFPEIVVAGPRFHLRPLLPLLTLDLPYYVLAISRKGPRFLRCSRQSVTRLDLPGAPKDLDDLLRYDDWSKELQMHSRVRSPGIARDRRAGVFHGEGGEKDDLKVKLRRYCDSIARGVEAALGGSRGPVVLAGELSVLAIYREASGGRADLFEEVVRANPMELRDEELRDLAGIVADGWRSAKREEAAETLRNVKSAGQSSTDPREILSAAEDGRVLTLFVAVDGKLQGRFDPASRALTREGDDDLLDGAAQRTLAAGGKVLAVRRTEMPEDVALAALFRY